MELEKYYLWPDGDFQATDDEDAPYQWKSDDFVEIEIPEDCEDYIEYLHQKHLEVNLGESCDKRTIV